MNRRTVLIALLGLCAAAGLFLAAVPGPATAHPTQNVQRRMVSLREMEEHLDEPGPLSFEHHRAAEWEVALSGLVNLQHPRARKAGLEDKSEPIFIDYFVIQHPEQGVFWVDSGVRQGMREWAEDEVPWLAHQALRLAALRPRETAAAQLEAHGAPGAVFLTHLHLDHVFGLPDLPGTTSIFVGPEEATHESFKNGLSRSLTDQLLQGKPPLQVLPGDASRPAIDLLGDQSLWAIYAPGHTRGSLAFVARTLGGPVLMTGDVCHTTFGFEHGVEPGSFTEDHAQNARSLQMLRELARRHPAMKVYLGHQDAPSHLAMKGS